MSDDRATVRHGIDLVHVPKIASMLAEHEAFEARVFTEDERAYCNGLPNPAPHFAARFAAKEAALKALGLGISATGIDRKLQEVEVRRVGTAPELALHGRPAEVAARLGVTGAALSLTHDGDHALASVVLMAGGNGGAA